MADKVGAFVQALYQDFQQRIISSSKLIPVLEPHEPEPMGLQS